MVTVVSAKDIAAADPGGLSDPYVTVKLNDEKHKTATKGNSKGKAEWGERFEWIKACARHGLRGQAAASLMPACYSNNQSDLAELLEVWIQV